MATSNESILGNVSGKLGKLIIYQRNGKICFRSKPEKISVPPSERQIYQRKAFAIVSSMLASIRTELEFGFSGLRGENSKRVGKAISLAVKKAVVNTGGEPVLIVERIQTSVGDLLIPEECQLIWDGQSTARLTWRPNSFEGNGTEGDRMFYLAYDPVSKRRWSVVDGGYRKNGNLTIQFPWSGPLEGKFYHFASFYTNRKGKIEFSDSVCLGKI
ncbi:hypothetical protein J0A68_19240 [Algoriphagus sp. H41]|uniref:Uncharacterized protein n=1 Tax=Algoriphagus oliviformis TaxID=2811231 RepID=A0ABS3C7K7_9BACT|nr:DUF6266 family protein [Algoriphagus oliviformis]MBN7813098.1 hypothetical protein [Algoriphagus oliviformis]